MRIINGCLLASLRSPGKCEVCGKPCAAREGHHIYTKGSGRVDIRCNLIAVGASNPFPMCPCHDSIHYTGRPTRDELLAIVAKMDQTTVGAIVDCVQFIRRIPKGTPESKIIKLMNSELGLTAQTLVERELTEAGVLT